MLFFPDNNLPFQSQEWADSIERQLKKLDKNVAAVPMIVGPQGAKGDTIYVGNLDGGRADSIYGGTSPVYGGNARSF